MGVLSSVDTSPKNWFYAYDYLSNVILTLPIFAMYLIVLGLYLSGHKTASLKIIMSGLIINYVTIIFTFAWWYTFISYLDSKNFTSAVHWIEGLSISVGIATTIGYEGIAPVSGMAQISVILQQVISFIISIILIAWIISRINSVMEKKSQSRLKPVRKLSK